MRTLPTQRQLASNRRHFSATLITGAVSPHGTSGTFVNPKRGQSTATASSYVDSPEMMHVMDMCWKVVTEIYIVRK